MTPAHARLAAAALFAVSTLACGTPPPTDTEIESAQLEGTWSSPCWMGAQTQLVYKNLHLVGTYSEYSDMGCTTLRHVATWEGEASGGEVVTGEVRKLDLTFSSFKSKPLTDAEAAFVNMSSYCGITDWAANVERDIMGRDCYNFSIPLAGKSLDIFERTGTTLQTGKGAKIAANLSEADRPTELDSTRAFTVR